MKFLVDAVASLLQWLGLRTAELARKFAAFSVLVGVNSAIITVFLAYISLVVVLVLWLFDKFNALLQYINAPHGGELMSLSFQILKSSGVWDGAIDAFSLVSAGFVMLIVLFLTRVLVKLLLHFRFTVFSLILSLK